MEYDNMLKSIGEFGPFQKKVYLILNCLAFFQCCQMFLLVFVADKPQWHCSENSFSKTLILNNDSTCFKDGSACTEIDFSKDFTSIVSEWKLICDQEYKADIGQSITMFGCLIGVIIAGRISDVIGRRYVTIVSQVIAFSLGMLTSLTWTYNQFLLLRFLCGLSIVGGGMSSFVIMTEIIGPSYRGQLMTISQMFYAIGFGFFALMAYIYRDWRHLTMAVSVPGVIYMLLFAKAIPESPRWLLAEGRIIEAEEILDKMAKKNGGSFDKQYLNVNNMKHSNSSSLENYGIHTLLTHKSFRYKMILLMFIWLINSMVYYGLSFNSKNLEGDRYWNFFFSGIVEVPSYFLAVPMIDNLGRRKSLFISVILGSLGCLLCSLGPPKFVVLTANFGKFGISSSFAILYVYSAELVPTVVRNFAMGTCSMTARFGAMLAPLVVTMGNIHPKLPMTLFGTSGIIAGIIGMMLPETLNQPVPDTLDDP